VVASNPFCKRTTNTWAIGHRVRKTENCTLDEVHAFLHQAVSSNPDFLENRLDTHKPRESETKIVFADFFFNTLFLQKSANWLIALPFYDSLRLFGKPGK